MSGWTNNEHIEALKALWADGLSASQIAAALSRQFRDASYTRNAVIGKAVRIGLARSRSASSQASKINRAAGQGAYRAPPASGPSAPADPSYIAPANAFAPLTAAEPRPWSERRPNECSWPVGGDGAEIMSCCAPVHARGWCSKHFAIGVQPPSVKRRVDERLEIIPRRRMAR